MNVLIFSGRDTFFRPPVIEGMKAIDFLNETHTPAVSSPRLEFQSSGVILKKEWVPRLLMKCNFFSCPLTTWISRAEIMILHPCQQSNCFFPNLFFVNNHFTLPLDNRIISILATSCGHVRSGAGNRLHGIYLFIIAFDKCLLISNFLVQEYRLSCLSLRCLI